MISVDLDKIVTAKGLQGHLSSILYEVEEEEKVYVITKEGRPRAVLVNVDYLRELTGREPAADREYDRYDQFSEPTKSAPPAEMPAEPPSSQDEPADRPSTATTESAVKPSAAASAPPTLPPPPQAVALNELADADTAAPIEGDPYAVTDEPADAAASTVKLPTAAPAAPSAASQPKERPGEAPLIDLNGLPVVPGQFDETDAAAR